MGRSSSLALLWISGSVLFLGYQAWLLPVLTDWVSSAVDEGFTSYAAQRIREGAWPHRDFFYLWTPGTPLLHALLQYAGLSWVGERAAAMAAWASSVALILVLARDWAFSRKEASLLALLLGAWSFSLWNIPYSSWYAVPIAVLAARLAPRRPLAAGLLFGLSFWFKQNIGILGCAGSLAWLLLFGVRRSASVLGAGLALALLVPFGAILAGGGGVALRQAFSQIFLFPFQYPSLMGMGLSGQALAAPLTSLGLWILSLFFLRADSQAKSARLIQVGMMAYLFFYLSRDGWRFLENGFALVSLAAMALSLAVALTEREKAEKVRALEFWLPAAGIFLQVFPRPDFQHFLFVFPIVAFLLVHSLSALGKRYPWLPTFWAHMPAWLLVAGGIVAQYGVVQIRLEGARDPLGRISVNSGQRLNEEVVAVWRFLKGSGLREGDPVLVVPNAVSVYQWTGFRNPTPHLQFFPGYVEAFGAKQADVLPAFLAAGGRFVIFQERSGAERNVPELYAQLMRDFEVVQSFPEHFTIYAPRAR